MSGEVEETPGIANHDYLNAKRKIDRFQTLPTIEKKKTIEKKRKLNCIKRKIVLLPQL